MAVFAVVLLVYALSASHTVGLEDDGLFILSSWNGGVSHPPGYPLYALFGKLLTSLPLGSVAFRAHMASALFGAGSAVALWWCIRLLVPGAIPAWAGALAFAFSRTYWSQAIVAEVYTLNAFFFFVLLAMALQLLKWRQQGDNYTNKWLVLMALVAGLSLTNHWPLMVLASPALILLLWPEWKNILRLSPVLAMAFCLGLLPYVWMVWRSQQPDAVSFYGPIDSWTEFLFIFLRKGYSGVDQSGTSDWWDKLYFSAYFLRQLGVQLGLVGFAMTAIGLICQARQFGLQVSLALLAGFGCSSLLLIALLGFDHSPMYEAIFRVYPLVAFGIMAIWAALGLQQVAVRLARQNADRVGAWAAGGMVFLLLPILVTGWQYNNRSGLSYPADYARAVLESLPANAVLFAGDDVGFGTTIYLNQIEKVRPDVTIREPKGLILPNRLYDPLSSNPDDYVLSLGRFLTDSARPVFIIGNNSPFTGTENLGFYSRFQSNLDAETRFVIDPERFASWEQLLALDQGEDEWLQIHRDSVSREFGYVLGASPADSEAQMQSRLDDYSLLAGDNVIGLIGISQGMVNGPNRVFRESLLTVLQRIEVHMDDHIALTDRARYYWLSGAYFASVGDLANAEQFLLQSLNLWASAENPAFAQLEVLYETVGRSDELDALRRQFQPQH